MAPPMGGLPGAPGMPPAAPSAPIGGSPATQPLSNKGLEAAGFAKLGVAIKVLQEIVPLIGPSSEVGKDVLHALQRLSKHIPEGSVSQGVQLSALHEILNKLKQLAPQMQAMQAARGGGAPLGGVPGNSAPPAPLGLPGGAPPDQAAA